MLKCHLISAITYAYASLKSQKSKKTKFCQKRVTYFCLTEGKIKA